MEDYTIIDGVALAIILISGFLAYARGLVRETLSIVGWGGAAVIAFIFAPQGKDLVFEIPFVNSIVGDSCEIALIISFALIFIVALVVISLFTPLLSGLISKSALGTIDRGLGFLFGLARGVLLIVVALFAYDQFITAGEGVDIVEESKTKALLSESQDRLAAEVETSSVPGWFIARFDELTSVCSVSTPAATETGTELPSDTN
ncbi:MAG: CvpA family protein [Rhodobacteraceae bacterium]|nr:CvpA family protein [Paracoccaceae bacterium]